MPKSPPPGAPASNDIVPEMLSELAYDVMNIRRGFKGRLKNTVVLSPWASSMFGFEITEKQPFIGIPSHLYGFLEQAAIYNVSAIEGSPGIYIVLAGGAGEKKRKIALRIYLRAQRVKTLLRFENITLIPMSSEGFAYLEPCDEPMVLPIQKIESLVWERL
jgi:hypothetical protein